MPCSLWSNLPFCTGWEAWVLQKIIGIPYFSFRGRVGDRTALRNMNLAFR